MLPDEQHTTGFSIQTFLIGIGAVVGSLLPSIMNKVFGLSNTAVAGEVADNVNSPFMPVRHFISERIMDNF
mgnify:CR=1 FL=1